MMNEQDNSNTSRPLTPQGDGELRDIGIDLFNMQRRNASVTTVGSVTMGGNNPVRVQSMTTTDTNDTEASAAQAERIIQAGGELVRLTTQGKREAENLRNINAALRQKGYATPLVADVHFNANVADVAALYAEKVRINPGNYVDPGRTFKQLEYTDEEYAEEIKKIDARFVPFLNICRENNTAVRIGVNHGSLSDRIMSRYGDTPAGIVESCMEFLRICKREHFNNVVISIKASNTVVMVQSVRLLVQQMRLEDMNYPLHLGVTEAGEGEDGSGVLPRRKHLQYKESGKSNETGAVKQGAVFRGEGIADAALGEKRRYPPPDGEDDGEDGENAEIETPEDTARKAEQAADKEHLADGEQPHFGDQPHLPPLLDGNDALCDGIQPAEGEDEG